MVLTVKSQLSTDMLIATKTANVIADIAHPKEQQKA